MPPDRVSALEERMGIEPHERLVVWKADGRKLEYNVPEPGMITITNEIGESQVMTIERFNELEEMQLL